MLQASLLSREGKAKEADAALAALATSSDAAQAAEAQLLRAQLAAASGNSAAALQHLSVSLREWCWCLFLQHASWASAWLCSAMAVQHELAGRDADCLTQKNSAFSTGKQHQGMRTRAPVAAGRRRCGLAGKARSAGHKDCTYGGPWAGRGGGSGTGQRTAAVASG